MTVSTGSSAPTCARVTASGAMRSAAAIRYRARARAPPPSASLELTGYGLVSSARHAGLTRLIARAQLRWYSALGLASARFSSSTPTIKVVAMTPILHPLAAGFE